MSYFGVLIFFLIPPLLVLIAFVPRDLWSCLRKRERPGMDIMLPYAAVLLHVALAVVYTTPWDNYLVATGVWYYNPALVTGLMLGYVPIEEYTFFILQSLLTGLWTVAIMRRLSPSLGAFVPNPRLRWAASLIAALVWIASTFIFFSGWKPGTYLTLILSWALIPVLLQIAVGADILWHHWRILVVGIAIPTLYLWWVDSLAITSSTWTIDPAQTTGVILGSLPFEEMLFFLMTNVIIVFGITLVLSPDTHQRLVDISSRVEKLCRRVSLTIRIDLGINE
jgi:lycopene cyclase domain-containing protein